MPSLLHRSALMQSRKVALISQDFVEQGNGLVQVSLGYTAAASDASSVLPLFRVDSQPPINPSMISLNELQSGKLYMASFSSSQANGLLQITASYVGASLNALRKPLISDSVERKNISIKVPAFRTSANRYIVVDGIPILTNETPTVRYDRYGIDVHLRNEEQQVAVVANEAIDYSAPPALDTNERAGLLMGATFTSRNVFWKLDGDNFSGVESPPQGSDSVFTKYSDIKLPGFEFRSMSALEIVQALATPRTSKSNAGVSVINTGKIEHVTPTVRLQANAYELQFNAAALYGKYGATIL